MLHISNAWFMLPHHYLVYHCITIKQNYRITQERPNIQYTVSNSIYIKTIKLWFKPIDAICTFNFKLTFSKSLNNTLRLTPYSNVIMLIGGCQKVMEIWPHKLKTSFGNWPVIWKYIRFHIKIIFISFCVIRLLVHWFIFIFHSFNYVSITYKKSTHRILCNPHQGQVVSFQLSGDCELLTYSLISFC